MIRNFPLMKFSQLFLVIGIAVAVLPAMAHDEDGRVSIESESSETVNAGEVTYQFDLIDNLKKKVLTDADLAITHEKKLHFLAYDPALKEFQHVHPEFNGKVWIVKLNFKVNGEYWVWAQGQLSADGEEFSGSNRLVVIGGSPTWSTPPTLGDVRTGQDGSSVVTLSGEKITAGQMTMLMVTLSRNDGTEPQITPYLGAFAHVVAVPEDGDSLTHVHPMSGANPNEGMLHANFSEPGNYRIWIQFMDGGNLKTVPLSVSVEK